MDNQQELAEALVEVDVLRERNQRLRLAVERGLTIYDELARAAGFAHEPPASERECIAAVKALATERDVLRAIIAGRTTAPTDAEIAVHAAAGGKWWVFARWNRSHAEKSANIIHSWAPGIARYLRDGQPDARWWALDSTWAPCAWPEVSNVG